IGVLRLMMETPITRAGAKGYTAEELRLMSSFEPRTMAESLQEMDYESLLEARAAGPMGDIPLIVLTAGIHATRLPQDGIEVQKFRTFESKWIEAQRQLAELSTRGVQIVLPKSHHAIQFDRPD